MASATAAVAAFSSAFSREIRFHGIEDLTILGVFAAIVPESVDNQLLTGGSLAEGEAVRKIVREGNGQIIGFERVEGNIDLVQRGGCQKHFLLLF